MVEKEALGFLGGGNMGEALIKGLLNTSIVPPHKILVFDVSNERLNYLKKMYQITPCATLEEMVSPCGTIIIAVKPQTMEPVLKQLGTCKNMRALVISIAAGFSLERLAGSLPEKTPVIRVMPNTPALVQEGTSALARGENVSEQQMDFALKIFNSVGKAIIVEEKWMDAVTGLSGSGPAYVLMLMESLMDAGVLEGLPRQVSRELVLQTFLGTAHMVLETGKHPAELKDLITSPGGTTIEGLKVLEERGTRGALMQAVRAATLRSRELGES